MEDLSARRRTPSPVRPASVAAGFYPPKTAEALHSPKKKVTRRRCRMVGFACLTRVLRMFWCREHTGDFQ